MPSPAPAGQLGASGTPPVSGRAAHSRRTLPLRVRRARTARTLNVYTPRLGGNVDGGLPVLMYMHGGRFTLGAGRDDDGTKLAVNGIVVVTINFRQGALGFLSHPALASEPGGPSGNYALMDQQAALRWVQNNVRPFGGDPGQVTVAGQSSGGLSVLALMISRSCRGVFHRAIVQSGVGPWALEQKSLAAAEADGEAFAAKAGCRDQTAEGLRRLPVADLVSNFSRGRRPDRGRRRGARRADRDGDDSRAVRPRADPKRDQQR